MTEGAATKTAAGRFFEDFRIGETIRHATPRTLSDGDASLHSALYRPCADFPLREGGGCEARVVLELDHWALAPRRP